MKSITHSGTECIQYFKAISARYVINDSKDDVAVCTHYNFIFSVGTHADEKK